jgi:hypothetical protein
MQFAKNVDAQAAVMKVEMVVVAIAVVTVVVVVWMLRTLFAKIQNFATSLRLLNSSRK